MDTGKLKTFAQSARRQLLSQVSIRLEQVLRLDSVETREKAAAILELKGQIAGSSKQAVIDRVAYTWFNRFCALRFMDVNRYTRLGIVSPVEGYTQPEILQEAKQGVIDAEFKVDRQRVLDILSGRTPSSDPQGEAYRLLLVGACNAYHQQMPFLFEPIEDYTELLMPDDLLSENSVLSQARQVLVEDNCQDVEIVGWLYQFYISERKDEVFENLKKNIKIEAKDIPAATQLFTPHWIVRYLVENSLGRLWMLNHPGSKLIDRMEYYIRPVQEETDFLVISSPEEIKVCDTACGSGHMLTYAFDLLYFIYEEQGYDPAQIPSLILQKNLYGIEIDKRAGDLAAFALVMKARARDRRFFSRKIQPNICVLQNISFSDQEIEEYKKFAGHDLFTHDLWETLKQFEQAENFGSLIRPRLKDVALARSRLAEKNVSENLFLHKTNEKVQLVIKQAEYLSPRYQVVLANPPYMSGSNFNSALKIFSNKSFKDSKSNLYAMFVIRNNELVIHRGFNAMITLDSWMFRSGYEDFRTETLQYVGIVIMAHLGPRAFDTISGEVVSTTAFILTTIEQQPLREGIYLRLVEGRNEKEKQQILLENTKKNPTSQDVVFVIKNTEFMIIPGAPIIYWATRSIRNIFVNHKSFGDFVETREGLTTGDNEIFLRSWYETSHSKICFSAQSNSDALLSKKKWLPYVKGGTFRRWAGNESFLINWEKDGLEIKEFSDPTTGRIRSHNYNGDYAFKEGFTWSIISSSTFAARYVSVGFMFDTSGPMGFALDNNLLKAYIAFLNCTVSYLLMSMLAPMLDFKLGHVLNLPIVDNFPSQISFICDTCIKLSKTDWDFYETSWNFQTLELISIKRRNENLQNGYLRLRSKWREMTSQLQLLEIEINRLFIDAYSLNGVLDPYVQSGDISLNCNPRYRYGNLGSDYELEKVLLTDTMKEFISYAVGCMFGRYSLDKSGLILANQGETARDYYRQVPQSTFPPDEDNVIPILEAGWFQDDIAERFKKFLRLTFGDEHYEENLAFIENAIGRDIRSYFLKEFYGEHLKMYKNRPIYWLFSSPSGAFNALIYMHRYQPDQVSILLNNYLREYIRKLTAHKAHLEQVSQRLSGSQAEKTKAAKEINALNKVLAELKEYEDEVLYPLATRQIQIDLDDGVKVNYKKFGKALKQVKGLSE